MRTIQYFHIDPDNCFFWDLADLEVMREYRDSDAIKHMVAKYGDIAREVPMNRVPYTVMPILHIITNTMQDSRALQDARDGSVYGFSNRALFAITSGRTSDGRIECASFQQANAVNAFLAFVFGSKAQTDFPNGDMSIMTRIARIRRANGMRDPFIVQMWFLPFGQGQWIADVKSAMIDALSRDPIGREFDVFSLDAGQTEIASSIHMRAGMAREKRKRGLIVITGDVGSIGVSIPDLDVVMLLNDIESSDMVYQQMMRVMTEAKDKRCAFVVDFNVFRMLNVLATYVAERCGHTAGVTMNERIRWCISHLVRIDQDLWDCRETPGVLVARDDVIAALLAKWRESAQSAHFLVDKLRKEITVIAHIDQNILDGTTALRDKSACDKSARDKSARDKSVSTGIEIREIVREEPHCHEIQEERDFRAININEIIACVIYDMILLCDCSESRDMLMTLEWIDDHSDARNALCDQIARLFPKITRPESRDHFATFLYIIRNNYNVLMVARETFDMVRARLGSELLDNPDAMIAYLSKHLRPRETEKKQMGEVFTPPKLICDMLEKLREIVPDIWTNPARRFLDPAAGIGNFPAFIYARLMDGLVSAIPDVDARRIHILTRMLYLCELNPKNVQICARIFHGCPHIYECDFLKREFAELKFDVIVGNPPYNAPSASGRATGNTLYPKFIEKCATLLERDGYQVMVHPGIWRKPGNKLHDLMFARQIHYLEIHTKREGQSLFGATTRYEWYITQNCDPASRGQSRVRFDDGEVLDISISAETPFLPNHGFSIIEKIRAKSREIGVMSVRCGGSSTSMSCSDDPTESHKFPFVNSTCITNGAVIKYSAKAHPAQKLQKVIFANNEVIVPFYDPGYFGTTQQGLYQLVADRYEGITLCKWLQSRLMQYMVGACKWSMFRTEYEMFAHVPFIRARFETDRDIYAYFDLSREEIARIEAWSHARDFGKCAQVLLDPRETNSTISEPRIEKISMVQLREKCRAANIRGRSKMSREQMMDALHIAT